MVAYMISVDDEQYGPFTLSELSSRRFPSSALVWWEGQEDWLPISTVPELAQYARVSGSAPTGGLPPPPGATSPAPSVRPLSIRNPEKTVSPVAAAQGLNAAAVVLGVFQLISAVLSLFIVPYLIYQTLQPVEAWHSPAVYDVLSRTSYRAPAAVAQALNAVCVLVQFVSGILLVKRRPEGIMWSNIYAYSTLVVTALGVGVTIITLVLPLASVIGADGFLSELVLLSGLTAGSCFGLIYPVFVLIMTSFAKPRKASA
jgi:hypothetical protein